MGKNFCTLPHNWQLYNTSLYRIEKEKQVVIKYSSSPTQFSSTAKATRLAVSLKIRIAGK
jgi:hypothetical protein